MPAPFTITFEETGAAQVEHRLLGIADRAVAAEPVLHEVADMLRQMSTKHFDDEGPGWEPLAESTRSYKASHDLDPRILHATLALRASLTEEDAEGSIAQILGDELIFGTEVTSEEGVYYPGLLKSGTSRMLARDPLHLDEEVQVEIVRAIQAYLVGEEAQALAFERSAGNRFP